MMTTGSKIYFKVAGTIYALAIVYGFVSNTAELGIGKGFKGAGVVDHLLGPLTFGYKGGVGDHFGYGILMGIAALAAGLGAVHIAFRDGSPEAAAEMEGDAPGTTRPMVSPSMWPFIGSISAGLVILGLANSSLVFVVGVAACVIVAFEWTVRAWSEQVSSDAQINKIARDRIGTPVELLSGLAIGALATVFCISRVLIATTEIGASIIAAVLAIVFIGGAFFLSSRPTITRNARFAAVAIIGILVLGAGIGGAIAGPAHEEHKSEEAVGAGSGGTIGSAIVAIPATIDG